MQWTLVIRVQVFRAQFIEYSGTNATPFRIHIIYTVEKKLIQKKLAYIFGTNGKSGTAD